MNDASEVRRGASIIQMLRSGDLRAHINAVAEMWDRYRQQKDGRFSAINDMPPHPAWVYVENRTGKDLDRFNVVQLDTVAMIDPTANAAALLSWQQTPSFRGLTPAGDNNRWAVMLDPLAANTDSVALHGRAVIAGAVQVQVNIRSVTHQFAQPVAGQTGYLESAASGPAMLLTQPKGLLGVQWCQVYLRCCSIPGATGSGLSGSTVVCGGCPTQMCVTFPGVVTGNEGGGCADCTRLQSPILCNYTTATVAGNLSSQCTWNSGAACCDGCTDSSLDVNGPLAVTIAWLQSGQCQVTVYGTNSSGGFVSLAVYGSIDTWDCTSPIVCGLLTAELGGICNDWPPSITVTPGACGTQGNCCAGNCGDPNISPTVTLTFTNKAGCWISVPDTDTLACCNSGANHFWGGGTLLSACSINTTLAIDCVIPGTSTPSGYPGLIVPNFGGVTAYFAPRPGYTCSPFSAIYDVTDSDGNTCTVTAVG